jgi:hypothetical protein
MRRVGVSIMGHSPPVVTVIMAGDGG